MRSDAICDNDLSEPSSVPPPQPIPPSKQHALELDSLRAIAIISVLFHHFLPQTSILNRMQRGFQEGPTVGVPLFFALSGFLITRILLQSRGSVDAQLTTSGHSLYIFYARRILRIFPIYYVTLFVGVVLKYRDVHAALAWHLLYLSNFYYFHRGAFDKGPAPVFWTLAVEEQFYLIWPLIVMLLPTRRLPSITLIIATVGALFSAWASDQGEMINLLMPAQLIYLAMGSYLGMLETAPLGSPAIQRHAMKIFPLAVFALVSASLLIQFTLPVSHIQNWTSNGLRYLASAAAFAWIVARLRKGLGGPLGTLLRWKALTYIGRISYGMYILQFFVTQLMDRAMPAVSHRIGKMSAEWLLQSFPARSIAIIAVASVSWFLLEKPMNDLKRFFRYPTAASRQTP